MGHNYFFTHPLGWKEWNVLWGWGKGGSLELGSTIWEWERTRLEEAGRKTQGKRQHRKGKGKEEQKREVGLLLPPTLFLPLFLTYSFLTLHPCGWKIILGLNNEDSGDQIMKFQFSQHGLGVHMFHTVPRRTACMNLPGAQCWPCEQAGISVTDLDSARLKAKPLCLPKLLGQCPLLQSRKKKGGRGGMIDHVKQLFLDFLNVCAEICKQWGSLEWGKQKCISQ